MIPGGEPCIPNYSLIRFTHKSFLFHNHPRSCKHDSAGYEIKIPSACWRTGVIWDAERGGFEPPVRRKANNGFRDRRIRPLCHLSFSPSLLFLLKADKNNKYLSAFHLLIQYDIHPELFSVKQHVKIVKFLLITILNTLILYIIP